jgi:DNA-binding GntR family transcriptional regulator
MPIERREFDKLQEKPEVISKKLLNFLNNTQDKAYSFQELITEFKVKTWELKNAIDILLIDDKIERRSKNGDFYFSCRK